MANQEKLRARKDEKIHDMAMEQKRRMEGAKKSGHILNVLFYYLERNSFQECQIFLQAREDLLE